MQLQQLRVLLLSEDADPAFRELRECKVPRAILVHAPIVDDELAVPVGRVPLIIIILILVHPKRLQQLGKHQRRPRFPVDRELRLKLIVVELPIEMRVLVSALDHQAAEVVQMH